MKSLSLLLCAVCLAFTLPACATAKKKECSTGGSCCASKSACDAHGKKGAHKH
jgi:hypothetical protein